MVAGGEGRKEQGFLLQVFWTKGGREGEVCLAVKITGGGENKASVIKSFHLILSFS